MPKHKKQNPRRRPVSEADVRRAKTTAINAAIDTIVYTMMYVLIDKHNASAEDLDTLVREMNYTADSVAKGYMTIDDIKTTLKEEYGFVWNKNW